MPPQAVRASLPSVSVTLAARQPPEGMPAEEVAAATTATAEGLPEPEPWRYIPESEAEGCNVIELAVSGACDRV